MTIAERKLHRVCISNTCLSQKINERTIAYIARDMLSGSGNTELLFREIAAQPFAGKFTHVIAVPGFGEALNSFKAGFEGLDLRFVSFDSDEFVRLISSAKYLISDGRLPLYYIRPKGQTHLCLFDQKNILCAPDEKGTYTASVYKELARLVPQTDLMLCANEEVYELMNDKLFLDSFYNGRLIKAAEPAHYCAPPVEAPAPSAPGRAKYSAEAIAELTERYYPSEAPEVNDADEEEFDVPGELPDERISMHNIVSALFFGESEYLEHKKSDKKKIAVIAYLHIQSRYALALRNFCDRIDKERFSVTVFAYATASSALCRSFSEGTRIIQRDDYTFSSDDMQHQVIDSDKLSEKQIWKYEILRSLGSDDFDGVLVYNTVNPFRHKFAELMDTSLRIYASPSESELLDAYYDPERLASIIDQTYDKTLLLSGGGRRLAHTEQMPVAYGSVWKDIIGQQIRPDIYNDGERELMALTASPLSPAGCTLIPGLDQRLTNILCIAAGNADAAKLAEMFSEYSSNDPDARLYLCVLEEGDEALALADEKLTVIVGKRVPLLLFTECGRFVYPYKGGSGLNIAAALLGAEAPAQAPSADEFLLMAGPANGELYSDFEPAPPKGELITDISVFSAPQTLQSPDLEGYEQTVTERINSLFCFERQETND